MPDAHRPSRPEVGRAARVRRTPGELLPGDVVELDGQRFEIVGELFLGMAGTSVFDHPQLFWRARIRSVAKSSETSYATWAIGDNVVVEVRHRGAEDHQGRRRS